MTQIIRNRSQRERDTSCCDEKTPFSTMPYIDFAGWRSGLSRLSHKQETIGSNPIPANIAESHRYEIQKLICRAILRQELRVGGAIPSLPIYREIAQTAEQQSENTHSDHTSVKNFGSHSHFHHRSNDQYAPNNLCIFRGENALRFKSHRNGLLRLVNEWSLVRVQLLPSGNIAQW